MRSFSAFVRDESGQAITEYILILSVCLVGIGAFGRRFIKVLDQGVLHIGGQLEKDLKTGRVPSSVWD